MPMRKPISPALYAFLAEKVIPDLIESGLDSIQNAFDQNRIFDIMATMINANRHNDEHFSMEQVRDNQKEAFEHLVGKIKLYQNEVLGDLNLAVCRSAFTEALKGVADRTDLLLVLFKFFDQGVDEGEVGVDKTDLISGLSDFAKLRLLSKSAEVAMIEGNEISAGSASLLARVIDELGMKCSLTSGPRIRGNFAELVNGQDIDELQRAALYKQEEERSDNQELIELAAEQRDKLLEHKRNCLIEAQIPQSEQQSYKIKALLNEYSAKELASVMIKKGQSQNNEVRGKDIEAGVNYLLATADSETINKITKVGEMILAEQKVATERSQSTLAPLYSFVELLIKGYKAVIEAISGGDKGDREVATTKLLSEICDNISKGSKKPGLDTTISPEIMELSNILAPEGNSQHHNGVSTFVEQIIRSKSSVVVDAARV